MALDWAKRMRFTLVSIAAVVVALLLLAAALVFFFDIPSCTDRKQNQDEEGIDCGGSCQYLCAVSVEELYVQFARPVMPQKGRTDVIAYIENRNKNAAAKAVPYTVELHGPDGARVGTHSGIIDMPAGMVVPLFIPAAAQGSVVTTAFITIDPHAVMWYRTEAQKDSVRVSGATLTEGSTPRITALLENPSFDAAYAVSAVAVIFDEQNTAVAASRTQIPVLRARTSLPAVFTWNTPFEATPARIEVTVSVPLP